MVGKGGEIWAKSSLEDSKKVFHADSSPNGKMLLVSFENFLKVFPVSSQANHIAMVSFEKTEVYILCLSSVKASQG